MPVTTQDATWPALTRAVPPPSTAPAPSHETAEAKDPFEGFPVLGALANHPDLAAEAPFRGVPFLLLLHPRESMVAMVEAARRLGLDPASSTAVIKPYDYPEMPATVAALRRMGMQVAPVAHLEEALAGFEVRRRGRDFVVIEDGGRLTCETYRRPELLSACLGFVEQTTRGRWMVEDSVPALARPHLYLPDSLIKPALECVDIGEAVVEAIERHLGERKVAECSFAVLGVGGQVGSSVARSLIARGAPVYGYDANPPPYFELRTKGAFKVCASKAEAISGRDVIIGATGRGSLTVGDLHHLIDGVLLVSASSEDVEFPVATLRQLSLAAEPYGAADGARLGAVLRLRSGKRVLLADDGRPVNLGAAAPPERRACFDLLLATMLAGAVELARGVYAGRQGWIAEFDDICRKFGLAELRLYFDREGI